MIWEKASPKKQSTLNCQSWHLKIEKKLKCLYKTLYRLQPQQQHQQWAVGIEYQNIGKKYISLKSKRNASIFKHIYEVIVLTFSPISIHTHQNTTSNRMRWWITKRWTLLSECNNSKNEMALPKLFVRSICITKIKLENRK